MACATSPARTLYPPVVKIKPTFGRVYTVTNMCSPFQRELDQHVIGVEYLLAPIFMMIMCSRGFILWIINFGLLIYLGVAERKLYKKVR